MVTFVGGQGWGDRHGRRIFRRGNCGGWIGGTIFDGIDG